SEVMYDRALQGYEEVFGPENITSYIPALNTIWNIGSLFGERINIIEARIMYEKALVGFKKVVGPN
ncbi:hypothetical protein BKA61DRAFT_454811, partial [Leptodontidium sp. MPI-SDFR-AT-0119]